MSVKSRNDWIFSNVKNTSLLDKTDLIKQYINYMLNRTQTIFNYKNLPKTIPKKDLEILLQINGFACITKVNDELYAFYGGLGGVPNAYYLPTIITIANPFLNFNKTLEIDKDCVVILNDNLYIGLCPMFNRNAKLLAECDKSIEFALINSRIPHIVKASNDNEKESFDELFNSIIEGKNFKAILSKSISSNSVDSLEFYKTNGILKELIETKQYLLGSWFQELGLNANYNMKRESLNENEIDSNEDILIPLIDEMLIQRKEGIKKVNEMFGTNIEVELSSTWKKVYDEILKDGVIDENEKKLLEENEILEGEQNEDNRNIE